MYRCKIRNSYHKDTLQVNLYTVTKEWQIFEDDLSKYNDCVIGQYIAGDMSEQVDITFILQEEIQILEPEIIEYVEQKKTKRKKSSKKKLLGDENIIDSLTIRED